MQSIQQRLLESKGKFQSPSVMRRTKAGSLKSRLLKSALLLAGSVLVPSCSPADPGELDVAASELSINTQSATNTSTPIGLAIEIENGVGTPIKVRAGQRFFINQIDFRTFVNTNTDNGVNTLRTQGDFATLNWNGVSQEDQEFLILPNPDGTFTRRRFFRDADWMDKPSLMIVTPVNAQGIPTGTPLITYAGTDTNRNPADHFFVRRMRGIQWTYDCVSTTSCANAHTFQEEALIELRNAMRVQTFRFTENTTGLQVRWSLKPSTVYTIPVTQVPNPTYDYNFNIDVTPITPPLAGGFYAPGTNVSFKIALRDGSGNRLHDDGHLPPYNDVVFGPNEAGIQYYRAFFDPSTVYYRRKHRERMLMSQVNGPVQDAQPIRTVVQLSQFLNPAEDSIVLGLPARDGWYSEGITFPPTNDLFGGAFDPSHAGWAAPVDDTFTYHIPADAKPGTYLVSTKGRRVYLGQDIPSTTTFKIQVGTAQQTQANLDTGPCNSCHKESSGGALKLVLHGNDNRAACAGCHSPLAFELEGPIAVRLHFIHSRSNRFDAPLAKCASCHLTANSIKRTSKAACLSCHKSYPADHVQQFGPIQSMYVGGGEESFQQCTSTCHSTHPGSKL